MKAIVTGISGQDGYYMAAQLLQRGWVILGLTTNADRSRKFVGDLIVKGLTIQEFDYRTPKAIDAVLRDHEPDVIFNFAGFSSGRGMFDSPYEILRVNGVFVVEMLEAIRSLPEGRRPILCQASSSEMFGDARESPQCEETPLRPKSPYAVAKALAHHAIGVYRSAYGVPCCSAILYNHESIRRSEEFVTKKIARAAARIKSTGEGGLDLGALGAMRDWGYAPEYMEALFRMVEAGGMEDYVISTGKLTTVRQLCEYAFGAVGLDYRQYVREGVADQRITVSKGLVGCSEKIAHKLEWRAQVSVQSIMEEMVRYELGEVQKTTRKEKQDRRVC